MKFTILTSLLVGTFALAAPSISFAWPTDNGDGSQTCTASGPSSGGDGVCANDLATNESYCDGGMSSEPGGGVTCSPGPNSSQPSTSEPRKKVRGLKN
jgi:hypothetical protein